MPFHIVDGTAVLFPTFSDRESMNITPLKLLSKLLATNPNLRYRNIAAHDIDSTFKGILASASVSSYEVKADWKVILHRWETSSEWGAVQQILRRADIDRPGPKPKTYTPLEVQYSGTKSPLPVQRLSERTREKLIYMGNALRVYLPSRVGSLALTNTTHIHLFGHNKTGGPNLYEVEIIPEFHPSVALEFNDRSLLNRFRNELQNSVFSLDNDQVTSVVTDTFDANAHKTIYTLGSGPVNDGCAVYESLRWFFVNKGYVANSDVLSRNANGAKETYVKVRGKLAPSFLRKLGAILGGHRECYVPAFIAETCNLCRGTIRRAQLEHQAPFQVKAQSRTEPEFCQTGQPIIKMPSHIEAQSRQEPIFCRRGPPKVRLPVQRCAPLVLSAQPDTRPDLKRKRDTEPNTADSPKSPDEAREEARKKLKKASEALTPKLKRDRLPTALSGPEPLSYSCNDDEKKRKRERGNSPDSVTGLETSGKGSDSTRKKPKGSEEEYLSPRSGSNDTHELPKFAEKEVLTAADCAELARDLLTELEESLDNPN